MSSSSCSLYSSLHGDVSLKKNCPNPAFYKAPHSQLCLFLSHSIPYYMAVLLLLLVTWFVCVWGVQAANPVQSGPVTAEKTENEFLSWFLQEYCFWGRPWESPTRVYLWCYDEPEVGGLEEEDDALGVKSKRRLNLASCPTVSDCFPGSRT